MLSYLIIVVIGIENNVNRLGPSFITTFIVFYSKLPPMKCDL